MLLPKNAQLKATGFSWRATGITGFTKLDYIKWEDKEGQVTHLFPLESAGTKCVECIVTTHTWHWNQCQEKKNWENNAGQMLSLSMMAYPPSLQHSQGDATTIYAAGYWTGLYFRLVRLLHIWGKHPGSNIVWRRLAHKRSCDRSEVTKKQCSFNVSNTEMVSNDSKPVMAERYSCLSKTDGTAVTLTDSSSSPPLEHSGVPPVSPGPAVTLGHNTCLTLAGSLFHG